MNGFLRCLSFVACVAFSNVPIQAACGGGGFKSTKQTVRKEEVRQENTPQEASSRSESTTNFDTSRFDAVSARLSLSQDQYQEISKAKREIRERLDRARREVDRAQANLDRCQDGCESEERKLAEAKAKLSSVDAKREFDRRVEMILSENQNKTYRSTAP